MYKERSLQIKTMTRIHNCYRSFMFGLIVSPEWIGRHYMTEIENKQRIKHMEIISDMKQTFRCDVSIGQCRRAKNGKLTEHYVRIRNYSYELLRSNHKYTCKALGSRWKSGCTKVIGLGGCFLKGEVKSELLTAVGIDENNTVYPIAWLVVDVENKTNWTWFLELIHDDLMLGGGRGFVIISHQHKHRQCARHIYENFRNASTILEFKKNKIGLQ
uniref:MULE transposase domain-containing protein n=1 Tax=Lactuca sativa TaxID=4236 RepID=A0A9R1WUP3_LACSA|nr:hypothetical protein LSAT_V11C900488030 [Lactuca sativa]